jgi:hypothetical protein
MSFQNMLDKKCNIHKVKKGNASGQYGLPSKDEFSYSEIPDFSAVLCTYKLNKSSAQRFESAGPIPTLDVKFYFLPGTNVELGDVISIEGRTYRADIPRDIRGNHVEVLASYYEVIFNG